MNGDIRGEKLTYTVEELYTGTVTKPKHENMDVALSSAPPKWLLIVSNPDSKDVIKSFPAREVTIVLMALHKDHDRHGRHYVLTHTNTSLFTRRQQARGQR
jgi:hypothetical protein